MRRGRMDNRAIAIGAAGTRPSRRQRRRGFILFVVLVIVAMIALMAVTFFYQMNAEFQATRVRGYVVQARSAAMSGGAYVQPSLAKPLLARHLTDGEPAVGDPVTLTPRQLQLLRALASGRTNKELAHDLGISHATVKSYLKELYERLGVTSRAGAVA